MIGPMLNYLILGLVLLHSSRASASSDLIAYILFGSVVFNFMSVGFNQGSQSMVANENYIKKIYLPKMIFPVNSVLMEFVNFVLQLMAVTALLAIMGKIQWSWALITLPPFFVFLFLFTLGLAMVGSVVAVFFRDLIHLVPIMMQAIFFLTPIVYVPAQAPEFLARYNQFNPFYIFVEVIRDPLTAKGMTLALMTPAFFIAIIMFVFGLVVLKTFDNKIVFRL